MRKLLQLFCVGLITIIIGVIVISMIDHTYSQIENNTFSKKTNSYEIKVQDNMFRVKNIKREAKEGVALFATWPWLPLGQFEKYKKLFIAGASFETNYNSNKK
jgi:hypothetical protein